MYCGEKTRIQTGMRASAQCVSALKNMRAARCSSTFQAKPRTSRGESGAKDSRASPEVWRGRLEPLGGDATWPRLRSSLATVLEWVARGSSSKAVHALDSWPSFAKAVGSLVSLVEIALGVVWVWWGVVGFSFAFGRDVWFLPEGVRGPLPATVNTSLTRRLLAPASGSTGGPSRLASRCRRVTP